MTEANSKVIASAMQSKYLSIRKTNAQFIQEAQAIHGDKYDYSNCEYINSHTKINVFCRVHNTDFQIKPYLHLSGRGCYSCGKERAGEKLRMAPDEFFKKCDEVHGGMYVYDKDSYKSASHDIRVYCSKHDMWFHQKGADHIKGHGCFKCGIDKNVRKRKAHTKDFYDAAYEKHKNSNYIYPSDCNNLKRSSVIEIICLKHGSFSQRIKDHISGNGCFDCGVESRANSSRLTQGEFIERATAVHGGFYCYDLVEYKTSITLVKIICPEHSVFEQRPSNHLGGEGCPFCARTKLNHFIKKTYVENSKKNHKGMSGIYLIKCENGDEVFYKIGITVKDSLNKRFSSYNMPYDFKEMYFIRDNVGFVWDLEKRLHAMLKKHKYQPKISFGGETECFSHIPKEVIKFLDDLEKTDQLQLIA